MEKGKSLAADCLVMDLEDAVAPEAKAEARELACKTVQAGGYGGRELVIRVNGAQTQWHEKDVRAVARSGAAALMLPKVESAAQINVLDGLMKSLGAPDGMDIWCLIETPIVPMDHRQVMH